MAMESEGVSNQAEQKSRQMSCRRRRRALVGDTVFPETCCQDIREKD